MSDPEITAWADHFWRLARQPEKFPRSFETAVLRALPLAIVKFPSLAVAPINEYFSAKKLPFALDSAERRLRGCLIARCGRGFVFLDGGDPQDEQQFTLAHEVAHFLLDHYALRLRAIEEFGPEIIDVLDGRRPPTIGQRWSAALRNITLRCTTHLFDRDGQGAVVSLDTLDAEDRADRLALELLAPEQSVAQALSAQNVNWNDSGADAIAEQTLIHQFGLPDWAARRYARLLTASRAPPPSYRDWLTKKVQHPLLDDSPSRHSPS